MKIVISYLQGAKFHEIIILIVIFWGDLWLVQEKSVLQKFADHVYRLPSRLYGMMSSLSWCVVDTLCCTVCVSCNLNFDVVWLNTFCMSEWRGNVSREKRWGIWKKCLMLMMMIWWWWWWWWQCSRLANDDDKCKNDVYKNSYRWHSCTSKTAKIHHFVRFVMYCSITTAVCWDGTICLLPL